MNHTLKSDIYFISDAHLGGDTPQAEREKEMKLCSFLEHIRAQAEVLYIVGDLFDPWFEYRWVIPNCFFRILKSLFELRESGTRIVFVGGNHDAWTGRFLDQEIGLEICPEACQATHQGLKFYITHGDGLARGERGYRVQRWIMRNPCCVWLYRLVHPDIGIPLARWVSHKSRNRSRTKEPGWNRDAYRQAAMKILDRGYDVVVFAHIHCPSLEPIEGRYYLNTGDWIRHFSYGRLKNGELTLGTWAELPTQAP